jgi:hypothetical protein
VCLCYARIKSPVLYNKLIPANDSTGGGKTVQLERTVKLAFTRMFVQQELKHENIFFSDSAYCGEHLIHSQRLGRTSVENETTEYKFIKIWLSPSISLLLDGMC